MEGFNVKRAPQIHVNGTDVKMIDFGNPNGKWPFSEGTGLTAEEKMPISDAKIALDKALNVQHPKIIDQMHKMRIVGAESSKIPNELNILPNLNILPKHGPNNAPKLGSKNAIINKDASGKN
ncbi:hypothetical protein niasHS_008845 [Heterodera schachtii]|uniref:Uncharacterized protein n=1 Tax=Heterodera schachtii TaxID=97005 RepID=A0ABD2J6Q1_HETSC